MKGKNFLLISILVLGFILRIYNLSEIPSGFFADEASIGVNAYTILKNGTDEYGTALPTFFRAFGEYKSSIQIYATVPFIALFGLNEFSVRLPSAIFGTLTIISLYLLTKELLKRSKAMGQWSNEAIPLLAALFLTISPWHIHFSRVAFETMPFIFFTVCGLLFFLKALKNPMLLFLSVLMFALAIYSYFPARIFIPLFTFCIIIFYFKFFLKNKKIVLTCFVFLIIILIPFIKHSLSKEGATRWNQVNIFSQPPNEQSISAHIINNYLSHFSPDFLFLKGDIGMPGQFVTRHSVRGMGQLYLFQLPLIFLGLCYLIKKREKQILLISLVWVFLYPLGSMFTIDKSAQATRSIIGVVPFQILSALGIFWVMNFIKCFKTFKLIHLLSFTVITVIISLAFVNFLNLYFVKYPLYSSDYLGWQYGYRDIVKYLKTQEVSFDQLLITHRYNYGEELLKFYNVTYQCNKCLVITNPISINTNKKQLFALRKEDIIEAKKNYNNLTFFSSKIIYLPNKSPEIHIGEFVSNIVQ